MRGSAPPPTGLPGRSRRRNLNFYQPNIQQCQRRGGSGGVVGDDCGGDDGHDDVGVDGYVSAVGDCGVGDNGHDDVDGDGSVVDGGGDQVF